MKLLACFGLSLAAASPAWAIDFFVTTNDDSGPGSLRQAIIDLNSSGGASNNIIISSGLAPIGLTSGDLQTVARNVTIVGNGNTLSGNNQFRGLFIGGFSGTTQTTVAVAISDLTIVNARAVGGSPATGGGGGGAGLGGALFVADQASLTVSNVTLVDNAAFGGSGGLGNASPSSGGGGMGGAGGSSVGGGGGLGSGATGGNNGASGSPGIAAGGAGGGTGGAGSGGGTSGGANGGGGGGAVSVPGGGSGAGGGVGGANGIDGGGVGGAGGFGGGGGAGSGGFAGGGGGFGGGGGVGSIGGAGGFGGGGGGGGGAGGFGGGNGATDVANGGGGAGLGGSIFVQQGGTLTIAGAFSVNGGVVLGGGVNGSGSATAGSAFGAGMFLQGNGTINFAPGAGQMQTVSDVIADQAGSGGIGSYGVVKEGAGTTTLSAANTYTGGTTINAGTLSIAANNGLGAAAGGLTFGGGTLQTTGTFTTGRAVTLNAGGGTFETAAGTMLTATGVIDGSGGLTKLGTGTLTLEGDNSYTGATTISVGTLALSATGSIAASSGVVVGSGATFLIGDGVFAPIASLAGSGTVVIGSTDPTSTLLLTGTTSSPATSFSGTFAGLGSLELDDSARLTLSGAGTDHGTIGGDLILCNCSTGGLTLDGGQLTVQGLSEGVTVFGGTLAVINGGSLQIGPPGIGSNADLLVAGTLNITGPGSTVTTTGYTGIGIFDTGTLAVSGGGVLNSQQGAEVDSIFGAARATIDGAGSAWTLGGIGLAVGGGGTGGIGNLTVTNGGVVNVTSGDVVIGDAVDGSSTLRVSGTGSALNLTSGRLLIGDVSCGCGLAGTLTVEDGAVVTATGGTVIETGSTLRLGTGGAGGTLITPTIANGGAIVADFTDAITLAANISGAGSLTKAGAGTLILSGTNSYTGGTTVSAGILQGTTSSLQGDILNNAAVVFDQTADGIYAGVISGNGSLTKSGTGSVVLSGANLYTGGTTVNGGLLQLASGASLASGGALTINGGTFDLNGNNQTVGALSGTGGAIELGSATLTTNSTANTTFAGAIGGAGGLVKQGNGTFTLTGNNSYTGATTISAGTLALSGGASIQGSSVVTVNGTFDISNNADTVITSLAGSGSVVRGSSGLYLSNASTTFAGVIAGSGNVVVQGGTQTLSGVSTFTGAALIDGGATLALAGTGSIAAAQVVGSGSAGGGSAVFDISQTTSGATVTALLDTIGNLAVRLGAQTLTITGGDVPFGGTIEDGGIGGGTGGGLTLAAGVRQGLTAASTYTGATTLAAGASLLLEGAGSIAQSSGVSLAGGAVLSIAFAGGGRTIGDLSGAASSSVLLGNNTLTLGSSNSTTYAGVIQAGSGDVGSLVKQGSGTLTLSGSSLYSGTTLVADGTLQAGAAFAFAAGSAFTVASGGTLDLNGFDQNIASLAGAGTVALGSGTLTAGDTSDTTFAGAIGGSGGLVKEGSGTFTVTGFNAYTGTTTVNAGTLAIGAGGSIMSSSLLTVGNNATFDISGTLGFSAINRLAGSGTVELGGSGLAILAAADTFAGTINGGGGLEIVSGTQTLSGTNSYSNTTQIDAGATLALAGTGSIANSASVTFAPFGPGTATFDISQTNAGASIAALFDPAGIGVVRLGGQTLTISNGSSFNGVIADGGLGGGTGGGLAIAAGATQELGGINSYTGATTIAGNGTLALTGSGSVAASSGVGLGGAGASLDISGAAGGATIQSLSGVSGSTVQLGANRLTVGAASSTVFAGTITDGGAGGAVTKTGTGTLTLTGANSYTGGTTISGGILQVGNGGTSGSIAGDVLNDATLAFNRSDTITFGGLISGSGALDKLGSGTLILTADNTYSGLTTIASGTLQLGNGGTTGSIAGNVLNNGVLAFNRSDNVLYGGNIDGSGVIAYMGPGTVTLTGTIGNTGGTVLAGGIVQAGADSALGAAGATLTFAGGTLQATGSFTVDRPLSLITGGGTINTAGNTLTVGGNIGGAGGLTKSGAGTLILSGSSNYTGGTTVSGGVLQGSSASLQGNILNNANVTFDQVAPGTFVGNISGSGSLTKTGIGALTLTGTNSYGGGTVVSAGILRGNSASLQGSIENNAAVIFDQATDGTYAGAMGGAGSFTKTGAGTLILTGANSYAGGTVVSAGTLQGDITSLRGDIVNNATLVFNETGTSGPYGGNLSGTGVLIKTGSSGLYLTGTTVAQSLITVSNGFLLVGPTTSVQSNIVNNASVLFQTGTAVDQVYAGNMSGTGSLEKSLTGTLILTGTNSYTGGTTVSAGTLQGNSSSLQGNIVNNAAVIFEQLQNGTYAGNMTGTGTLAKAGAGTLILTGTNAVGGGTTVNAGLLVVNGSLTGGVTVAPGATLGGSGQIVGPFTSNGGTLTPGNSIGTLNVNGSFTQNGGVYQVEVNAAGQSDLIAVTGAPGTATITGGATVQVLAEAGTYQRSTTYTILSATGGVTGTYTGVTSNFAFLTPTLSYGANNVFLTLVQTASAFASGAQTANQFAVGTALDIASPTASGDFATVLNAMAGLNTQQGPAALNAISGQPYTGFGTANVASGLLFMNTLGQQMAGARGSSATTRVALAEACAVACDEGGEPARWGAWMSGLGGLGSVGGNSNAGTFTYNFGGTAFGLDYRLDPKLVVGAAAGYTSGRQWVSGFQGNGSADNYSAALYASFASGGFYADGLAGYAYSDNQMQRVLQIPGLTQRIASGRTGANQFLGQVEAGYRIGVFAPAALSVSPFARLQTVAVSQNGFTETGANSLNLGVAQQNTTSVRTVLGSDLAANLPIGSERLLGVALRLGWAHEYAQTARPITASFAGAPAVPFTVYGAQPLRDAAVIGFGLNTRVAEQTSIYARYDGEINGRDDAHGFSAGFRMTW